MCEVTPYMVSVATKKKIKGKSVYIIYIHTKTAKVKNGAALKNLGEKSCEIKGGSQDDVNSNNAHSHY